MDDFVFIGFWRRVAAMFLDFIICIPLIFTSYLIQKWSIHHKNVLPEILITSIVYFLYVIFVSKYGGTPGKLIMKINIVDQNGDFLKWKKVIVRYLPLMSISIVSIFQYIYVFKTMPSNIVMDTSLFGMGKTIKEFGGPFQLLLNLANLFYFIDVIVIVFNKKKRAIHDFLADSYVIEKQIRI